MGRSTGDGQEQQSSSDRRAGGQRKRHVRAAVNAAVAGCVAEMPGLTMEEVLVALTEETGLWAAILRDTRQTPARLPGR
jgi:hypothetical protein